MTGEPEISGEVKVEFAFRIKDGPVVTTQWGTTLKAERCVITDYSNRAGVTLYGPSINSFGTRSATYKLRGNYSRPAPPDWLLDLITAAGYVVEKDPPP